MEKLVFYKVYFFEDLREGKKYYYEDRPSCELARLVAYKRYDRERLSTNNFVVPISKVNMVLINENDIANYNIFESFDNQMGD